MIGMSFRFEEGSQWLQKASLSDAGLMFLFENLLIFVLVLLMGDWLVRRYRHRPVTVPPAPLTRVEIVVALANVVLNTLITLLGWQMWKHGLIRFRTDVGWAAVTDVPALLLIMDLLMYWLHRVAHLRFLYPYMHLFHHRYERVRPLTLFALNPVENLGFGFLWLAVISVYPASWLGMSVYLALNVVFGAVGHLGVEPLPNWWVKTPVIRYLTGSSFHAQHHQDLHYNFGFYTLLWDRIFGTLRPDYHQCYGQIPMAEREKTPLSVIG